MISDYISFNAARFVKDYYRYIQIVDDLKAKLNEIDYIRSVPTDADKVQTSPRGDQIEKIIIRRIAIEERINDHMAHIKTFEKAYNDLLPDEKKVLDEFFTADSKMDAVLNLEDKGIPRSTAYNIRKQALEKIAESVAGVSHITK